MRHYGSERELRRVHMGPRRVGRFGRFFAANAESPRSEHYRDQVPTLVPKPGSPTVTQGNRRREKSAAKCLTGLP